MSNNPRDRARATITLLAIALATVLLTGALIAGDSAAESLRVLWRESTGRVSLVLSAPRLFEEDMAAAISHAGPWGTCPIIVQNAGIANPAAGLRLPSVAVYGIDDRFWTFHNQARQLIAPGEALINETLAQALNAAPGATLLLHLDRPSPVPAETWFGPKEPTPVYLTVAVRSVLDRSSLGNFTTAPGQAARPSLFFPLAALQSALDRPDRVNTILISTRGTKREAAAVAEAIRERADLTDVGLRLTEPDQGETTVESEAVLIPPALEAELGAAAQRVRVPLHPLLAHLVSTLRAGNKSVPYSFAAAVDPAIVSIDPDAVFLNDWTGRELGARAGGEVTLEYPVWQNGRPATKSASFRIQQIVPISDLAGPDLIPDYPGIAGAKSIRDWKLPFALNLGLVRPQDEEYWRRYQLTPKALLNLYTGQNLWRSRFGEVTGLRADLSPLRDDENALASFRIALQSELNPLNLGFDLRAPAPPPSAQTEVTQDLLVYILPLIAASLLVAMTAARPPLQFGFVLSIAGVLLGIVLAPLPHLIQTKELHTHPLTLVWGGLGSLGLASFCILTANRIRFTFRRYWPLIAACLLAAPLPLVLRGRTNRNPTFNVVATSRAPVISKDAILNVQPGVRVYALRYHAPDILGVPADLPNTNRLRQKLAGGIIPALAVPGSRFKLREQIVLNPSADRPLRVQVVGFLGGTPLEDEILIPEDEFLKAFPETEGYRYFLLNTPDPQATIAEWNSKFSLYGMEASCGAANPGCGHAFERVQSPRK